MRILIFWLSLILIYNIDLKAQLPTTQMNLIEGDFTSSEPQVTSLRYLTDFNPNGYNNQPYWISDSEVYFTSNYEASGLTDIYKINLSNNRLTRLTQTEESEYSPQLTADGTITVVRQELNDSQITPQTLWGYPVDLASSGDNLIPNRSDIGYYCMLPADQVALFIVGDKSSIRIVSLRGEKEEFISYNIGRCMRYDENGGLIYIQKLGSSWLLKRRVWDTGLTQTITPMMDEVEDFDLLSNGNIVAGKDSVLYIYNMSTRDGWEELIDLSSYGINKITRLAASNNKMIVVSQ